MQKNYYFNDENATFTINNPETGKYWYNHLWNKDGYHMAISHIGHGVSRYVRQDGKQAILNEEEARYFYIRDEDAGSYWNIGIAPSLNKVENYSCEHGLEHTRISAEWDGVEAQLLFTLPETGTYEIWKTTVKNKSSVKKKLSLFPVIRFDLGGFVQPPYYNPTTTSETFFIKDINGVFCWSQNPHQPHKRYSGFLASSEAVAYYDGWLERFIGTIGNYARPYVLENHINCTNSIVTVRTRGAVLQNTIELEPGEEKVIYYFAGLSEDPETVVTEYRNALSQAEFWCENYFERGLGRFGALRVTTPDERVNHVMNFWAQKQVSFCIIAKKAVRDNAQISMGILNFDTALAKRALYECLCHQYSDGHAVLAWSPAIEEILYSDPSMWLIMSVCELIKESGEISLLDESIPFLDGEEATVYEHLKRAAQWLTTSLGPNGLPLIHYADWNDALNIPDENAESVFMAMGVCWVLQELVDLASYMGDDNYAARLVKEKQQLAERTNKIAWNGDYYVRALSKFGKIGDKDSEIGGKIYVNPQSWAILAGIVPEENITKVFEAIDSMDTEYGIPICSPPYKEYNEIVGRMSGMLPGVYENGGIYNHACGFKLMADCKEGRSEKALDTFLKILPDGEINPSAITTTEPYVFTNCYLMNPATKQLVSFSWMTGTSAWALRGFYEGILGLRRSYEGLRIKPAISSRWKQVRVQRQFRGCTYHIEYINNGGTETAMTVDGKRIAGDLLPVFDDQKIHHVTVEINS